MSLTSAGYYNAYPYDDDGYFAREEELKMTEFEDYQIGYKDGYANYTKEYKDYVYSDVKNISAYETGYRDGYFARSKEK